MQSFFVGCLTRCIAASASQTSLSILKDMENERVLALAAIFWQLMLWSCADQSW